MDLLHSPQENEANLPTAQCWWINHQLINSKWLKVAETVREQLTTDANVASELDRILVEELMHRYVYIIYIYIIYKYIYNIYIIYKYIYIYNI